MIKFSKSDLLDVDLYEKRLRHSGYIVFDRDRMNYTLQYERANTSTLAELVLSMMTHKSSWKCATISSQAVLNYLMFYEGCPEHYFKKRGVEGYSLDSKKVLQKLKDNGYASEFLETYMAYVSKKYRCGKIQKIVDNHGTLLGKNKDGVNIYQMNFSVFQQKNMRYNYSNTDIIAIPKEYNDCITVEDGYFLAWGDFAQSDFRIAYNLFIRSKENDLIMGQYEDKYEALARIVANAEGREFDLDRFKLDRPLYKQLTLATIYGTRGSVVTEEATFISNFCEFLRKCPKYVEYEKRLRDRAALGLPLIVQSYFGHTEACPILYSLDDTVHNALNSPVQSCTSEVVILTTNKILDMFYGLGYTEDDVSVYYVRHDEPVFKIKESVLKDIWVLNQVSKILVDDWSPLAMSFNFGYYYKKADEGLELKVQEVYERNSDKIVSLEVGTNVDTEYYPIAPLYTLTSAQYKLSNGKTVIALYKSDEHKVAYYLCESQEDDVIFEFVKKNIALKEEYIYNLGYRGIRVISSYMEGELFYGNSYVKFMKEDNGKILNVTRLCRYMAWRYCMKYGVEDPVLPPYKDEESMINSVKELFAE